jgi:hypothetical protein
MVGFAAVPPMLKLPVAPLFVIVPAATDTTVPGPAGPVGPVAPAAPAIPAAPAAPAAPVAPACAIRPQSLTPVGGSWFRFAPLESEM